MRENIRRKYSVLLVGGFIVALGASSLARSQQLLLAPAAPVRAVSPRLAANARADSGAAVFDSLPADSSKAAMSQSAFLRAWTVFDSPRCKNCHPAGDAPLQGDDSHGHIQNVKRGADGHGVYGMTCHTCHQNANLPGADMPPGNPKWSLPPDNMKMIIQGETPGLSRRSTAPTLSPPCSDGWMTGLPAQNNAPLCKFSEVAV
jgi:cytochrome c5